MVYTLPWIKSRPVGEMALMLLMDVVALDNVVMAGIECVPVVANVWSNVRTNEVPLSTPEDAKDWPKWSTVVVPVGAMVTWTVVAKASSGNVNSRVKSSRMWLLDGGWVKVGTTVWVSNVMEADSSEASSLPK